MLYRPDEVWRTEGIVDHDGDSVFVRYLRHRVDIRDIAVRISQGFKEYSPGVFLYSRLDLPQIMDIHKARPDSVLWQRMRQQVEGSAIDRLLSHDMSAIRGKRLYRIRNCRRAGRQGKRRTASFKSCQSFLQHLLGGIRESAVNIAGIGQTESVGRMLAVMEHIRGRLINRNCPRVCRGIGLFLPDMQLKCFKSVFAHNFNLPLFLISKHHAEPPALASHEILQRMGVQIILYYPIHPLPESNCLTHRSSRTFRLAFYKTAHRLKLLLCQCQYLADLIFLRLSRQAVSAAFPLKPRNKTVFRERRQYLLEIFQ